MIIHHKSHAKLIVILLITLAVIGGSIVIFTHFTSLKKNTPTGTSSQTTNSTNKKTTEKSTDKSNNTSDAGDNKTPTQYSDSNGNSITDGGSSSDTDSLAITANLSAQPKSNIISVVINITNLVSNDGSCQITAGSYTISTSIIANSNYSSCEINSIPLAKANQGQNFSVTIKSGNRNGSASGVIQ